MAAPVKVSANELRIYQEAERRTTEQAADQESPGLAVRLLDEHSGLS